MSDRNLAFVYSAGIEGLRYPEDCPFKTQRAGLTRSRLLSLGLLGSEDCREVAPRLATRGELEQFHLARYLDLLERVSNGDAIPAGEEMGVGGPDTPVFKDLFAYGSWACGAALTGADLLLRREADVVFSLMGGFHHAMAGRAGGFCYLNDPVLACLRFVQAGQRVLYLDVDAHHGDGVQEAFYARNEVLNISLHESGQTLFPWGGFEGEVGEGPGLGYNVNVSLPPWTYDEAFVWAYGSVVLPLLQAYQPDAVVLELGMDTLAGDPLTHLQMTNNIVIDVLTPLLALRRPLLVLGGGGYHVENTVRAWSLAWRTCCGGEEDDALSMGLGGVMMESMEWAGGLRDRALPVTSEQRRYVENELKATVRRVVDLIFPLHGLNSVEHGFG